MKKAWIFSSVAFLAGAVAFALLMGFFKTESEAPRTIVSPPVVNAEVKGVTLGPNFVPLVKKVKPAVVKVISESEIERGGGIFDDDFFGQFFNTPKRRERVSGTGSGFLVSDDGYIITNNHVIQNALKIRVIDIDGKEYKAKKIGQDPKSDLALLRIEAKNLPYIELGDSNNVEVGEWVLAIGNPLGQDLTVTSGIVSAKGRRLEGLEVTYQNFIQTDAAINQGNSGGPMINMEGKAIGINSVILSTSGGNIGIGFAIPSNMAKKVIGDLKKSGKVIRGFLGISIKDISEAEAKDYDLPKAGALITNVEEDSPAKEANLKRYDLIVAINGKDIKSSTELMNQIANLNPGDSAELTIYRNNQQKTIKVKVGEAPESERIKSSEQSGESVDIGMVLRDNSRALSQRYELSTSKGIVVMQVERGSIAERNGIREGDVILAINRTEIESVDQFRKTIAQKGPGSRVLLFINRNGQEVPLNFMIPE